MRPFKLVVLVVVFGWLQIIAQAVISSLTIVWHRSSHVFTSVAIYTLIVVTAIGLDLWLHSNGFMRPDYDLREWLYYTIVFGLCDATSWRDGLAVCRSARYPWQL